VANDDNCDSGSGFGCFEVVGVGVLSQVILEIKVSVSLLNILSKSMVVQRLIYRTDFQI
jgi:hypothetical protein